MMLTMALLIQADALKYGVDKSKRDKIEVEQKLELKIEGTQAAVSFVRSLHPFLSMEKLRIRADGTARVAGEGKRVFEYDEARVELRYDDEDHELDYKRGDGAPPEGGQLRQLMFYLAAGGRNFSLSAGGEYRSEDKDQDHNGEAMDLMILAITRMPDGAVKEGQEYEKEWRGSRSEKGKKGVYLFKQKVKVEKLEKRGDKTVATLVGKLTGKLDSPPEEKDKSAEEAWSKCEGETKLLLEVETGRVLSSEGSGKVTAYYRGQAEDGTKNEVTLTFTVEGKTKVR